MARFLLVGENAGGTVPPMVALAEALVDDGHSVTMLNQPSVEARSRAAGCDFVPFSRLGDYATDEPIEEQLELAFEALTGRSVADDVIVAAERQRADVVVVEGDMASAAAAAEHLDCPSAILLHHMYKTFVDDWFVHYWPFFEAPVNAIRSSYGLAPSSSWWDVFLGHDRVLSAVPPTFDAPVTPPRPGVRAVGFLVPRGTPSAESPTFPDGDEPAVVVGLSTTNQQQQRLLQAILDALGELDVRAVATTGRVIDASELVVPPNVRLLDFVPHTSLLGDAALMVTHAGLGTIAAALGFGVPLVCAPTARDQHVNAARVVACGAGVDAGSDPTPSEVAAAVSEVLEKEDYRAAALAISEENTRLGGAARVAADLATLAR